MYPHAYHSDYLSPKFTFCTLNLVKKFALAVGLGLDYGRKHLNSTTVYVLNLAYTISDQWGLFIEIYASFTEDYFEDHWDAGLSYLVNKNLQIVLYRGLSK